MPDFYSAVTSICSVLTCLDSCFPRSIEIPDRILYIETTTALLLLNLCSVITCYPIHESCFAVIYFRPVQVLENQALQEKMANMC